MDVTVNAGHSRVYENRLNVTICRHVRLSAYRTAEDYCPLVVALPQICRNLEQMVNIRTRQRMVGNSKNFRELYMALVVFTLHISQRVAGGETWPIKVTRQSKNMENRRLFV